VFEACRRGVLARRLPELRRYYQAKRDVMVTALRESFGDAVSWPTPRGGFFLWAALPQPSDSTRLVARAVEHGVIDVSGDAFFVESAGRFDRSLVRLSFSAPSPEDIREGVRRLASAVQEEQESLTKAE
jgi:2-aminoadipate transaminase